ncbi:hypothetical protein ACQY0O_004086 [Thecaphora frezii]
MHSYNSVNSTNTCGGDYSLNHLLKGGFNFQGAVISDWGATWSNERDCAAGLDVTMPCTAYHGTFGYFGHQRLVELVKAGKVSEERLDDMVLRTLGPALHLQDLATYPQPHFDMRNLSLPTHNVRRNHHELIRTIGKDSITPLKNQHDDGRRLPLQPVTELRSLALLGRNVRPGIYGAMSCGIEGMECNAGNGNHKRTITSGGGSGWAYPPYVIDALLALQHHVRAAGPDINCPLDNYDSRTMALQASRSEAALVFFNAWAVEGSDRDNMALCDGGDGLIQAAAKHIDNTIAVVHVLGPVDVSRWIDQENVTAVLYAYYPELEAGALLPAILWVPQGAVGQTAIYDYEKGGGLCAEYHCQFDGP